MAISEIYSSELLEYQQCLIGALCVAPEIAGEYFVTVHGEDFLDPTCRHVHNVARSMYLADRPLDSITLLAALGAPQADYRKFLQTAMELMPTAVNWKEYARIVHERTRIVRIRQLGGQIAEGEEADIPGLLHKLDIVRNGSSEIKHFSLRELMMDFYDDQERKPDYLTFGFSTLDDGMLYVEQGDYLVIGARPSVGKTAFALQLSQHIGRSRRVGFFSLETSPQKLAQRYTANAADISFRHIKRREMAPDDWTAVSEMMHRDSDLVKLFFIPAAGMTVEEIQSQALIGRYDVIVIDYLQIITPPPKLRMYEAVTQTSMALHTFAQRHGITVIALAQLSRAPRMTNQKTGKTTMPEPTLDSLRESGQIEQDADVVMLLYLKDPDKPNSLRRLKIAKNKEGRCGRIWMKFDGDRQIFSEVVDEEADLPPDFPQRPTPKPPQTPPQMRMSI
jgi:replicative DNA helicase